MTVFWLFFFFFQESLFDRHEFLSWLIELPDKMKQADDVVLKLILVQLNLVCGSERMNFALRIGTASAWKTKLLRSCQPL